jgi:hypothetical protein
MQLVAQLVVAVEPAWQSWGTAHPAGCSHYEEEYLIGQKGRNHHEEGRRS